MHKTAKITFTTFLGFKSKVKKEFIARLERFECLLTLQLSKGLQTTYATCRRRKSGKDIGQEINVGPGKFGKKNKRRALKKRRAWKIWQKFEFFVMIFFSLCLILNLINVGPFKKAVGPGKKIRN